MQMVTRSHALAFMVLCLLVASILRLSDWLPTPPGLHYDEAANMTLASEIAFHGKRPIFISSYTGKEVFFFYLMGGMMRLLGVSIFTMRLTAAFVALLTIAATYWLARECQLDRRLALIAAALLTVSLWHIIFSRLGFRAISQPLLQVLTLAALFRGLQRQKWSWFVVSGVLVGLAGYTYLAVRLFPLLLLLAFIPLLLHSRQRWGQLALFGLVGLIVLTPLIAYFFNHPDAFWVRIGQVSPGSTGLSLQESILKSLGMFFAVGDPYLRFNIPGRPLFNWFWGGLLIAGWLGCIQRLPRVPYDWQKAILLLLILAPFIMLLPTALATNEIVPSNLRAIGLIPLIFYLPATGLMIFLTSLKGLLPANLSLTTAVLAIGTLILLVGGLYSAHLYTNQWAANPELFYESDGDMVLVASFLDETDLAGLTIYMAAEHYQHPTLAALSQHYDRVKWLPQSQALVFAAAGPAIYIYPHNSPRPAWTERYLGGQLDTTNYLGPDGEPAFNAYLLASPLAPAASNRAYVNFGNTAVFLGYDLETGQSGGTMAATLYWQITSQPTAELLTFVHLQDRWQQRWSQVEPFAYPSRQWQVGEFVMERVEIALPAGMPPSRYRLRLGLFDPATGVALPRYDEFGRYAGNAFFIEDVAVTAAAGLPAEIPAPPYALDLPARPGLLLLGYERGKTAVTTGETIDFGLWWQVLQAQPAMILRFELIGADNTGYILANSQPVHNSYPFAAWSAPQLLIDRHALPVSESVPSGEYQLWLRLLESNSSTLITADLGPVRIEKTERIFSQPAYSVAHAAVFGNEIALVGYDLTPLVNGQATLNLYWQAQQMPSEDYTVFVHVLAQEDGACCVWQQDVMPQQNQYPTTRWLAGEYVVDSYLIVPEPSLAAGRYPLEIGLYLAETGRRLSVTVPDQATRDVIYLRPLEVD